MTHAIGRPPTPKGLAGSGGRYGSILPRNQWPSTSDDDVALGRLATAMVRLKRPGKIDVSDNPNIPAGYTYFGQFVDHDLTLDLTSSFEQQVDPDSLRNFRTANLELDSVYGAGQSAAPYLFDEQDRNKFRIGKVAEPVCGRDQDRDQDFDLPRIDDTALLADARNDENLFINQLHVAFLRLHNRLVKDASEQRVRNAYEHAQQRLRKHYQWVIVHDYLPRIVGKDNASAVRRSGRVLYDPLNRAPEPFVPVEFSVAAFRFGHVQVRDKYVINSEPHPAGLTVSGRGQEITTFRDEAGDSPRRRFRAGSKMARHDLQGGVVRERDIVDWSMMLLTAGAQPPTLSRRITPALADSLARLPERSLRDDAKNRELALRNLRRGRTFGLADGVRAAEYVNERLPPSFRFPVLTDKQIWEGFDSSQLDYVPLWFYLLREAELHGNNGHHLGPLGARIVLEVFHGILERDPESILNDRGFVPDLGVDPAAPFDLGALLAAADMPFGPRA